MQENYSCLKKVSKEDHTNLEWNIARKQEEHNRILEQEL